MMGNPKLALHVGAKCTA